MEIIPNRRDLVVRNLEVLPRGTGAPYLECMRGPNGELIAKAWRRRVPKHYDVLIQF